MVSETIFRIDMPPPLSGIIDYMTKENHKQFFDAKKPGSWESWNRKMQDVYNPSNKLKPKPGERKKQEQEGAVTTRKAIVDLLHRLQHPEESDSEDT